ncbi:phospholipase DDHD2-like isoform X2 [Gigantopelta aegis]|uniref:phospholipase DDHD2-like isoform X2 n=1 Tax=Gigantopelta aegis TaxID=1735272 RepID=UPI001B88DCAC|nr:phospholipase DDHD2-like isoform X2 [Gigantopelta aegis]
MADRGKKDSTPPPLLFMPAGGGLTLTPPEQPNVLMPVIQSEPSLLGPDEEGEADSFVGQTPPKSEPLQPGSVTFFDHGVPSGGSDPFSQIGQPPPVNQPADFGVPHFPPTTTGVASPAQGFSSHSPPSQFGSQPPFSGAGPPPSVTTSGNTNIFRQSGGRMRYAAPPSGTYATASPQPPQQPLQPSHPSPMMPSHGERPPPTAMVPPVTTTQSSNAQFLPQFQGQTTLSANIGYQPVQAHWCYCKVVEAKDVWYPFSLLDSVKLEHAFSTTLKNNPENTVVSTNGGRYDVNVGNRTRHAIYWDEEPTAVRRCTWFYKRERDNRFVPYVEEFANKLEEEYNKAIVYNMWHKRLEFPGDETIVMHNPNVIVHFQATSQPDEWGNIQSDQMRPRVVKRGIDDFETIEDGEPDEIDHLVFIVHGIGATCDAKFRNVIECVDDFRSISHGLIKTHFPYYKAEGRINRVEYLPVQWHKTLHSDKTGVDRRLQAITLKSTAKLRHFVNDTLLDILFYTSPSYCQLIASTVAKEMNRLFRMFSRRNPNFGGSVSVAGHSLGSSILFDLLLHQKELGTEFEEDEETDEEDDDDNSENSNEDEEKEQNGNTEGLSVDSEELSQKLSMEDLLAKVGLQDKAEVFEKEQIDMEALTMCSDSDLKDLGLPMGPRKKLLGILKEQKEEKEKKKKQLEEQASKDAERQARRQEQKKKEQFLMLARQQASAKRSASICVEFISGLAGTGQPFVEYPQLIFETSALFAIGSPIGVFLAVRGVDTMGKEFRLPNCPHVFNIFHPYDPVAYRLEPLVNPAASNVKPVLMPHHKGRKRFHLELKESLSRVGADIKQRIIESLKVTWNSIHDFAAAHRTDTSIEQEVDKEMNNIMEGFNQREEDKAETESVSSNNEEEIEMGRLNAGGRIDYVLQEAPIESFNEYLFALSCHGGYWESEDTVLLILKQTYAASGMMPQMPGPEGIHQRAANAAPPMAGQGPPPPVGGAVGHQRSQAPPPGFAPGPFSQHVSTPPKQGPPMGSAPHHGTPPPMNQGPPPVSGFVRSPPK